MICHIYTLPFADTKKEEVKPTSVRTFSSFCVFMQRNLSVPSQTLTKSEPRPAEFPFVRPGLPFFNPCAGTIRINGAEPVGSVADAHKK